MTTRRVFQYDAAAWLDENPAPALASVITSLPDVSELPDLGFSGWRTWFMERAAQLLRWIPDNGVAIFFQSDVKFRGVWIDKSYLVQRAAEDTGAVLLWHKIVCRHAPGTIALGRPSYSHMLAFAHKTKPNPLRPGPDVIPDAGAMPWSRAMGVTACEIACLYLKHETPTQVIVDPFCGRGTVLSVAQTMGFDAIGVDISGKRCRAARTFDVHEPAGHSHAGRIPRPLGEPSR